jgi:hypothetical protein
MMAVLRKGSLRGSELKECPSEKKDHTRRIEEEVAALLRRLYPAIDFMIHSRKLQRLEKIVLGTAGPVGAAVLCKAHRNVGVDRACCDSGVSPD